MKVLFLLVVLGTPAAICIVAVIGAHFHEQDNAELLDWRPALTPEREAQLRHREVDEMLEAVNRYRRQRGESERTLEQISSQSAAARPRRGSRRRRGAPRR
ncbi:MAG: hypothetical protein ACYCUM_03130 [Solirubrobacteraceae bacterium]